MPYGARPQPIHAARAVQYGMRDVTRIANACVRVQIYCMLKSVRRTERESVRAVLAFAAREGVETVRLHAIL